MPYNAPSSISMNSSLYPINQIGPQAFVSLSDTPSFTSQIKKTTNSTQAFASAKAYSAYSGYANPQIIVADPVNPGFNLNAQLDRMMNAGE